MIQKIVKDSDIKFNVSEDSKIQDKFIIKFYTVNKSNTITKTAENVILENEKRYIKLNWSELRHLENGMINYEVNNLDSDADYNDGVYNSTFTRTTYYYLYTDTNSGGGGAGTEEIEEKIDDLNNRVSGVETKVDQVVTDLNKEKEDRAQGDTNLTNTITENDAQYQSKFKLFDEYFASYNKRIQGLDDRMTELEFGPRLLTLENDYEDLNNRKTALYDKCQHLNERYGDAQSYSYSDFNESMTALEQKVTALETKTQDIQNSVPVVEQKVSSVATNNDGINNRAMALETDTQDLPLEDRIKALENKNNSIKSKVSDYEQDVKDFENRYPMDTNANDIQQKVTALEQRVTALETGTQDIQNSMSVVEPNNGINDRALTLETDTQDLNDRMSVATNNDGIANQSSTELEQRVSALENEYNSLKDNVDLLAYILEFNSQWPIDTSYSQIQERMSALENRIKALESK